MGRRTYLLVLAALLSAFLLPNAAAETPIPGTPLYVVELGPTSQVVPLGSTTNFSWGLYNVGNATYTVDVSAAADDPAFVVNISSSSLVVAPGPFLEVHVNVTSPAGGAPRSTDIEVWFNVTSEAASLRRVVLLTARQVLASADVLTAFAAIGGIIAIGFTATLIFERTRVPDLLILILLGLLIGPVALTYFGFSFVPPGVLALATPYFTAMALMIILFDGGLNLRLREVVRYLNVVALHTGMTFILTLFLVAWVTVVVLGYPWLVGLLLGAVLAGTSSAVVIGIVRALRVSEETKILLTLESVVTDVLCVVTVIALIEFLRGGPGASVSIVIFGLGQAFLVALVLGVAVGIGWLLLLSRLEKKPFSYMLTIAVLFVLYALTESVGGSGAMASFVFGLILGNQREFGRRLLVRPTLVVDDRIKQFHSELSFVIRTFFFVFLGLVFTFQFSVGWAVSSDLPALRSFNGTFSLFLIGVVLTFLVIVSVRFVAARVTALVRPKPPAEKRVLWTVMGRGLAAAVLASLPFTIPAFTAPSSPGDMYYAFILARYQAQFLNIAFFIILLTVGATTLGVAASDRRLGQPRTRVAAPDADRSLLGFLHDMDLEELQVQDDPIDSPLPTSPIAEEEEDVGDGDRD